MKRCPQCRRDYTNETLNFCLDDGAELLDGPASGDESATVILDDLEATRSFNQTTAGEAEPQTGWGSSTEKQSFSAHRAAEPKNKKLFAAALIVAVMAASGFFGYRYF